MKFSTEGWQHYKGQAWFAFIEKQTENRHDPYSKVLSQNSKILLQKGLTTQKDIWQYKDSSVLTSNLKDCYLKW